MADTYTANYNLVKIEQGSTGWAGKANGNMDTIDGVVFLKIGYDAFNNVGIGTLTPSTKLHVVSSINQGIMVSDGTTIGIMFPSSTLTNSLAIGTQSNHPLLFGTNNTFPRMMIDANGNVGIGTSTPNLLLEVYGGGWRLGTKSGGTYNGGLSGAFNEANNIYSMYFRDRTDTAWNDAWIEAKSITFKTGITAPVTVLTIENNGQVSLSSPSRTVEALKCSNFGYNTGYPTLLVGGAASYGSTTVCINVDPIANPSGDFAGDGKDVMFKNGVKFMTPNTANDSFYNDIICMLDGNVGIGTKSPGEKLEVSGAVKIGTASGTSDGTVRWTGTDFEGRKGGAWVSLTNTGSGTVNTGTSGYFAYYPSTGTTVDDSSVLYTSGTNVGVGVTSLTEKLEIAGAIKIGTAAGTADGTIRWTGTDFEGRKGGAWSSLTAGGSSYWGRTSPYVFPTTTSDGICLGKTVDGSELAKIDITTTGASDAYIFRHVPGSGNGLLLAYDYSATTYQLGDSGSFSFEIGVINSWTLSNGIRVDANHLHCTGIGLQVDFITAPTSASATGIAGEIRWDTSYIYICTATNTWKKVAIATW